MNPDGLFHGGMVLAFVRFSAFFVSAPFPGKSVPGVVRILLAVMLAWALVPPNLPPPTQSLWLAVPLEAIMGLGAGFLLVLALQVFAVAGEIGGQQMGLGTPGFVDPLGSPLTLMGSTFTFIALGVFALGDGPAHLLAFLAVWTERMPPGTGTLAAEAGLEVAMIGGAELYAAAARFAAPTMTAVFIAQLLLAVLARAVPQLNLFVEGPALTISAGLVGLLASLATFAPAVATGFDLRLEQLGGWLWGG